MGIALRQFSALVRKNFIISRKSLFINFIRCLVLPVLYLLFVAEAQHFFQSAGSYGVGSQFRTIRSLDRSLVGDLKFLWIDQSSNATLARTLIADIVSDLEPENVIQVANRTQLAQHCPENFNQVSQCFGAVVFQTLNYTQNTRNFVYQLRLDNGLYSTNVNNGKASLESHHFPIQWAVDSAIFRQVFGTAPPTPAELPFTQIDQTTRLNELRLSFIRGTREITALAFFVGFVGVIYHLVGFVSTERELLLTQLLDTMGCSPLARYLSWHVSFDLFYFLSWLFSGLIVQQLVFTTTNGGMVIMFHVLFGFAIVSWSLFVAVFFRRAQLSGIGTTICAVILAILAMVGRDVFGNAGIIVLSIVFPPMSFIFAYIVFCNFERYGLGVDMLSTYNQNNSTMLAIFICVTVDIFLFAFLAIAVEHWIYGTGKFLQKTTSHKQFLHKEKHSVVLQSLNKIFKPFSLRRKEPFYAVKDLNLSIKQGEVFCLLGANGSGKSTTLGMIAGSLSMSSGDVLINGLSRRNNRLPPGLLSLCPQKNILWSDLTVLEHVQIWSAIKSAEDHREDVVGLIDSCDLSTKIAARSATLSGGMMRKLQLAIAFCGNSQVVLIDEVSSGIDPLARRKLHDIILDARGIRTQILTTHFLDEADLLADRIALLSKGTLTAEGVPVALKQQLGKGYMLNVITQPDMSVSAQLALYLHKILPGSTCKILSQSEHEYSLPTNDISTIRRILAHVEESKTSWSIASYDIAGPRLEDVFLSIMEEAAIEDSLPASTVYTKNELDPQEKSGSSAASTDLNPLVDGSSASLDFAHLALATGRQTALWEQILSQCYKRWIIFFRNPWPSLASIIVGVAAIGIALVFLKGKSPYTGSCRARVNGQPLISLQFPFFPIFIGQPVALGPSQSTFARALSNRFSTFSTITVASAAELLAYIKTNYSLSLQGGIYIDPDTTQSSFAWLIQSGTFSGMSTLNLISNSIFTNMLAERGFNTAQSTGYKIVTTYRGFDGPSVAGLGDSLKFLIFFGVAMCVTYAFAALYPTSERLRDVKALQFSNGLTPLSLHLGHLLFELPMTAIVAVVISVLYATIIGTVIRSVGIFFIVLWLYGITASLFSFIVALFARSQLAAFAFAAGAQAVLFLCYIVAYLLTLTYAPALDTTAWIRYEHFTLSAIPLPIASITRAIIVGLNMFQLSCIGPSGRIATNFGSILLYGGPILYLIVHAILLFFFLVWWDSGHVLPNLFGRKKNLGTTYTEVHASADAGVKSETERVNKSDASDVLLVRGVSKSYGALQAVNNISFGVARDEVLALLGPNSAGKSTTYGIIRGEVTPDAGDALIDHKSITEHRNAARAHLGVCPQFDAMDALSVRQHLTFYARVKGIPRKQIKANVEKLIAAVSLTPFADRLARKLSGGNQRKLSLAIAMIGNPSVLLIDEASSGMDIGAKRKIWETLTTFMPGRAVVITTHSMEEADALASRVGIIAKQMLAVGHINDVRRRYGDHYELAIICYQDDNAAVMESRCRCISGFITSQLPGSVPDADRVYHGHMKFKIPSNRSVASLFDIMEANKVALGIEFYGIQRSSLETAFLKLIRQHNIAEEGYTSVQEVPRQKR